MPINLKSIIEDDSAVKSGGFSGAIFLTYTLNLGFFEQIVAPALERAGCSNVLIIADPDGYSEAIEMGHKNVHNAGLRYVCTPLRRKKNGVQHVKMLFMAGPERGRLLIGSGNLTLHGYSQNLEIYSQFEYNRKEPDPQAHLAFAAAWNLLQGISKEENFSSTVLRQMNVIAEAADWLNEKPIELQDFAIWHNFQESIWQQFLDWRRRTTYPNSSVKTLRVFSPYFDQDIGLLCRLTQELHPDEVSVFVSKENTTLDGNRLKVSWPDELKLPKLFDIKEEREKQSTRLLHAKMVVGIEDRRSWCISGSANITRAAFSHSWQTGSNLEMVVCRSSPDPSAFDYLLDEQLEIRECSFEEVQPTASSDFSEQPKEIFEDSIFLTELTLQNGVLLGKLNDWPKHGSLKGKVTFQRSGWSSEIELDVDLSFRVVYPEELRSSETAFVEIDEIQSLPRWIDHPMALQEYGSRSYHERIQAKMDTVAGAESLFRELMEFLFNRVIPSKVTHSVDQKTAQSRGSVNTENASKDNIPPAPASERFIVPERDASGSFLLGNYTRTPYDHNIHSLRDLLSIVLLKLTLPAVPSTENYVDDNPSSSQKDDPEGDPEKDQISSRLRLCNYLIDYCKRYSHRLCQADFINKIQPEILFDNHFTLCRILIEFQTHITEFTPNDFIQCYWRIWAPIVLPSVIGLDGKSTWRLYRGRDLSKEFLAAWERLNISPLLIVMTTLAFGQPPSWSVGINHPTYLQRFLVLRDIIDRYNEITPALKINKDIFITLGIGQIQWDDCLRTFEKIANYNSPAKERLKPIFDWIEAKQTGRSTSEAVESIQANGLSQEFEIYQRHPGPILGVTSHPDDEGEMFCPRCGGELRKSTITMISKGKLTLCDKTSDVWLYREEPKPTRIL